MNRKIVNTIALRSLALVVVLGVAWQAQARDAKAPYPSMAPLEQYLMVDRNSEIALARSAAPESISKDAEVMVLGRRGYETAVKGTNGFVCMVERSWTAGINDPDFWNPKLRGAICFNPPAVRSYLPITLKKTALVLAGLDKAEMFEKLKEAFISKELPAMQVGAMSYMLSKQAYLSDQDGHWHPHLMFFIPQMSADSWGANLQDSPILASVDAEDGFTVFLVPVARWSDGTTDGE
jgi:hypothetical protein